MSSLGPASSLVRLGYLLFAPRSVVTRSYRLSAWPRSRVGAAALCAVVLALAGTGCGGGGSETVSGPQGATPRVSSKVGATRAALAIAAQLAYHPLYSL